MQQEPSDARRESSSPVPGDWWRNAVIYQVYIRSFCDADGDGIGDIDGIRQRLPYIAALGADAIWVNPWYPSPMADAGYDVADYRDVDPLFGTMADASALIDEAHELGLRVILDIVPNHTSSDHEWFRAALASDPGSPERARYVFRAGRGEHGEIAPNDWRSVFGGSAWTRTTDDDGTPGEWYLHLFAPEQPDLNWECEEVRADFDSVLRYWFDRGVDGFRIDVAHGLVKDPALPDLGVDAEALLEPPAAGAHPHWDLDGVHEIWRRWRSIADSYDEPRVFVAEAWVDEPERLARYLRPDELHTAFNFDFLRSPWRSAWLRKVIDQSISAAARVGAPATWVLSNHDVVREVSRYARPQRDRPLHSLSDIPADAPVDMELGWRRARAAALLMLALPGSAYVYQGEELGLPEVEELPDGVRQDPAFHRTAGANVGRDGCRVPLPWTGEEPPFGFSPPDADAEPWLPQPAEWATITADAQDGEPGSMLELYRRALQLRRGLPSTGEARLDWLAAGDDVFAFRRGEGFACVANLGADPVALPDGEVMLSSGDLDGDQLPTDTAAWIRLPAGTAR